MRRPWLLLAALAGAAFIALAWRELPAVRRYIKIERM